ncbi:quinone oxidoreductase family protein [Bordetella petrii]|uniref:quinone oxidoreductase family protein n=1 Tax=Bordetella petrii TaxID=94624 RepID=UPI001E58511E|nr:zinc-binding dehydrogenase [Bordetella petrii]MCD0502970.1 zinc-binding dehydrogenase [Bordetella petrii]
MTSTMRAIVLGPEGPALARAPVPQVDGARVRVRVQACALNRADLYMAEGRRHGDAGGPGAVLGLEWAGVVDAVGPDVPAHIRVGQPVMGSGRGAFADYAVADWGRVLPLPPGIGDPAAAAALPIALQTMHDALVTQGRLQAGQSVLIHGASTAVGLMALQIARYLKAGWVGGSSTSQAKRQRLRELGIDLAVDPVAPDWVQQVLDATGGRGADVVADMLAGPIFNATLAATAIEGRIVNVGRLAGRTAGFDFDLHALRRVHYSGVTFRTRTPEQVRLITARMLRDLGPALHAGQLRLPLDRGFALEEGAQALAYMQANRHFGKIILRVA